MTEENTNNNQSHHSYYCWMCGNELHELQLGFFECGNCNHQFLPSLTSDNENYLITLTCTTYPVELASESEQEKEE